MTVHVHAESPKGPVRLAFVGEAPGEEELEKGRPLVGPSGRIFNAMLRTAGIDRRDAYIGNVFDEKLPRNDITPWLYSLPEARAQGWAGSPPAYGKLGVLRPEHAWHLQRLQAELETAKPTVIVALGGTALWALTGSNAIGEVRGSVSVARYVAPGVKMLATFHPAHVMRDWKFFPVVVGDLIKAKQQSAYPEVRLPEVRVVLEPSLETLAEWRPRLLGADLLSVDIETGWGHILCVGFAPDAHSALVVPFVDLREPSRSYWQTAAEELAAFTFVKDVMEAPVPKLGQNFGAYDAFWFLKKWGIRPQNCREDTRILHHTLYPELPKKLSFMGASYTDQGPWKLMRARKGEKKED